MTNQHLATYAVNEKNSKGRRFLEKDDSSKYRSIFAVDRHKIINSASFRRLQYKTQVFVNHEGDHYRTRLTHSLEVAQIARWISGALMVNQDLSEVISLAHDLGHSPFGHAGEDILNEKLAEFNFADLKFLHNEHGLKLITKLEKISPEFDGLNLSWETLEGIVKHNGPILGDEAHYISSYNDEFDLDLRNYSSIEAQISAIADDIAYNNHDLEDGLRAELFKVEDLFELNLVGKIYQNILQKNPNLRRELLVSEAKKQITAIMVLDVIENSKNNISENNIKALQDVRDFKGTLVGFSKEIEKSHQELKGFLMKNMYRHQRVNKMTDDAKNIVSQLFDCYMNNDVEFLKKIDKNLMAKNISKKQLATLVCDYIAGMTDRFAIKEFKKINQL